MENEIYVSITFERYEQLIRSEHDANQLKALIANKASGYEAIDNQIVRSLNTLYNGNQEVYE